MTLEKRKKLDPIISWIVAMILCPFGVSFAVKSGFGVSMIEAPVYVLHLKISSLLPWYSMGTSEYVLQAVLLAVMCVVIRRFKWKYLLSFATAFLYGQILDGWNGIIGLLPGDVLFLRIVYAVIGCVVVAFAVALFFRTWLPLEVWELFVKEIAERFGFDITKVKWIYDFSSLFVGAALMLIFFGEIRFDAIGIGTIVTTFVNAPIIGFCSKIQDKFWNRLTKE